MLSRTLIALLTTIIVAIFSLLISEDVHAKPLSTDVSGTVAVDTTWTVTESPYVLIGVLTIAEGTTLTIEPGVVVKAQNGTCWLSYVCAYINVLGSLTVQGTEAKTVYITSLLDDVGGDTNGDGGGSTPSLSDWGGIRVQNGGRLTMDHVTLRYGGGRTDLGGGGIFLDTYAAATIRNSMIESNEVAGVHFHAEEGFAVSLTIEDSTIRNNNPYGISSSGTGSHNLTLTNSTIQSHTGDGLKLQHATNNVVITGNTFDGNSTGVNFSAVTVQLDDNLFINQVGAALSIDINSVELDYLPTNSMADNQYNAIHFDGSITQDATLHNHQNIPSYTGVLTIAEGATLTIEPGVVLKIPNGSCWAGYACNYIEVLGSLVAQGTEAEPIYITSLLDDVGGDTNGDGDSSSPAPSDWGGIRVQNGGRLTMEHVTLRYGGGRTGYGASGIFLNTYAAATIRDSVIEQNHDGGVQFFADEGNAVSLTIENSTIRNNNSHGVLGSGTGNHNLTIASSTFENNAASGIAAAGSISGKVEFSDFSGNAVGISTNADIEIRNNSFVGNSAYGVQNTGVGVEVDARQNWWGDRSGPYHTSQNPDGAGNAVSDNVIFDRWLSEKPAETETFSPDVALLADGATLQFDLAPGEHRYFKVEGSIDNNLVVSLNVSGPGSDQNAVRIVASHGWLPTEQNHNYSVKSAVQDGSAEISISQTSIADYYFMVYAPNLTAGTVTATVGAEYKDLHISSATPKAAGNNGKLTMNITGAGFVNSATKVSLISPTSVSIPGTVHADSSVSEMFVTFDLTDTELGAYILRVRRITDDTIVDISQAVTVTERRRGRLKLWIEGNDTVRSQRMYMYKLHYQNVGDNDMLAPFIGVGSNNSAPVFSYSPFASNNSLIWYAPGQRSTGGSLAPGDGGVIEFGLETKSGTQLEAFHVVEDAREFNWVHAKSHMMPYLSGASQWDTAWDDLEEWLGTTNGEVLSQLRPTVSAARSSVALDTLLIRAFYVAQRDENLVGAAAIDGDLEPVDREEYTVALAWEDVVLYDSSVEIERDEPLNSEHQREGIVPSKYRGKLIFPPDITQEEAMSAMISDSLILPAGDPQDTEKPVFDPAKKTIFVTHGWHGGHSDEKNIDLVRALARTFPLDEYNIVRIVWDRGSEGPPDIGCPTLLDPRCSNTVSERMPRVADAVYLKMRALGFNNWAQSIYIGHSFGNGVNAELAIRGCRNQGLSKCGTALLLNPASGAGYNIDLEIPRDIPRYRDIFSSSTAITTNSMADDWRGSVADLKLKYAPADCGGSKCTDLSDISHFTTNLHNSGPRFITCLLGGDGNIGDDDPNSKVDRRNFDGEFNCGNITAEPVIAFDLIRGYYALQLQGEDYQISSDADIYIEPVPADHVCYGSPQGSNCTVTAYSRSGMNTRLLHQRKVNVVGAIDPNDKKGPNGYGAEHVMPVDKLFYYTINFENLAAATAPVQELRIVDSLDSNLDWTTFQFEAIGFGDSTFEFNVGSSVFEYNNLIRPPSTVVTGTVEGHHLIDIQADFDIGTGEATWYLKSIDSATGFFPIDPFAGFLPPEDGSGRGQGYVTFSVKPKLDLANGATINNQANITFDYNNPIATNVVNNVIGAAVDLAVDADNFVSVSPDEQVDLVFTVLNDGPETAANASLAYTVPLQAQLLSINVDQGSCEAGTCMLGEISNGGSREITVSVVSADVGQWPIDVNVTSDNLDINPADNDSSQIIDVAGAPLAVTISWFHAQRINANIDIRWQTATETGTAGFNIIAEENGVRTQLNGELIPSMVIDSVEPFDYAFTAVTDATVFYLQEVEISGLVNEHGPFDQGVEYGTHAQQSNAGLTEDIWLPMIHR